MVVMAGGGFQDGILFLNLGQSLCLQCPSPILAHLGMEEPGRAVAPGAAESP